jgi:hypothetical protein
MAPGTSLETLSLRDTQWLYKQGDLLLGPVSGEQLVAKLYSGEVSGATEVSPLGEDRFRKISNLDAFKIHLAKAEAKLRVEAADRAAASAQAKKRTIILSALGGTVVVVAIVAALAAKYLAVHTPWSAKEDAFSDIAVEPPRISLAQRASSEEMVEYPGGPTTQKRHEREHSEQPATKNHSPGSTEHPRGAVAAKQTSGEPDGLQIAQADQSAIQEVVAQKQRSLYPCLSEEAKRSGYAGKVPLEFAVGNDGHVTKLWIDEPLLKNGPLSECLMKELQKWPFKPYQGATATVGLSFTIAKHG